MAQLHKKFTDSQVKEMLQRYLNSEIERPYQRGQPTNGQRHQRGQA